jgi:hypothetical protein
LIKIYFFFPLQQPLRRRPHFRRGRPTVETPTAAFSIYKQNVSAGRSAAADKIFTQNVFYPKTHFELQHNGSFCRHDVTKSSAKQICFVF